MESPTGTSELNLPHGLAYADLYGREGLLRIDALFLEQLRTSDAGLAGRLSEARAAGGIADALAESEFLLALAPHLEDFLSRLFGIETEFRRLAEAQNKLAPLFA